MVLKKMIIFFSLLILMNVVTFGQGNISGFTIPEIGKWMMTEKGEPAHWLGRMYYGKKLIEPINVIIIDEYSNSKEEAIKKLMNECKRNGYEEEYGHSAGYCGIIDKISYPQIPNNKRMAFSDKDFIQSNNHGRIMGPGYYDNKYIFIGAFSREYFKVFMKIHHSFASFQVARDDFCRKMDKGNVYTIFGMYYLENLMNDEERTTADHDGSAVVLVAIK